MRCDTIITPSQLTKQTEKRQGLRPYRLSTKFVYPMYLAGFHHLRRNLKLLGVLHHFDGFGSEECHGADEVRRAAFNLVFNLSRYQMRAGYFLRELAKTKVWSRGPRSFQCPEGKNIITEL